MIYLYNYAGEPWKAQYRTRQVLDKLYNYTSDGYCGDEDNGQTSAWYVMSALGFYPVTPATDEYIFGSPLFNEATLEFENGNILVIEAPGNDRQNIYIQNIKLNGKVIDRNFIRHAELLNGGELVFTMGPEPERSRGITEDVCPFSMSK